MNYNEFSNKYSSVLPPLSNTEYQQLKADINQRGILIPIIIDEHKNIIDGQHRLSIAEELGLSNIPFDIRIGLSEDEKQQLAIDLNLHRRHLDKNQIIDLQRDLRKQGKSIREIAEATKVSKSTVFDNVKDTQVSETGHVTGKDGKQYPAKKPKPIIVTTQSELNQVDKIITKSKEKPEYEYLKDELIETGKIKRGNKEVNRLKKLEKRQDNSIEIPDSNVWHGDFRVAGERIPDNSVDLIFTDPPYNEDAIRLYRDLGIFAKRVLKPGGLCLAYSGQIFLPQVMNTLSENLEYIWTFSTGHDAAQTRIFKVNVKNTWKPIVAYCKPPLEVWWESLPDSIVGNYNKSDHKWQQPIEVSRFFLSRLCIDNGLIVDPFCGSGTTLVAAKNLNLNYIGIEDDKDDVQKSIARLND